MAQAQPQRAVDVRRIVLFDGVCGFCDRLVQWLLARDGGRFAYAPLQGRTAAALRLRHPEIPDELETLVYVESREGGERVFLRSAAMFQVIGQLGTPWRWLAGLRWLPRGLTDFGYAQFVRRRYRLFGRLSACRIPDPAQRSRFLD
jgi:predicted DCC family thiol-disulfide oxidoreductase YuxK